MRLLLFIIFLALVLTAPCFALTGKVIRISDGDTVTILDDANQQHKVRLYGMDSPAKKQAFGLRARQALVSMIGGKTVDVSDMGNDRYGRIIGLIEYNGKSVNRQMVKEGWAWVNRRYCKLPECRAWLLDEARAREEKLGIWQDAASNEIKEIDSFLQDLRR